MTQGLGRRTQNRSFGLRPYPCSTTGERPLHETGGPSAGHIPRQRTSPFRQSYAWQRPPGSCSVARVLWFPQTPEVQFPLGTGASGRRKGSGRSMALCQGSKMSFLRHGGSSGHPSGRRAGRSQPGDRDGGVPGLPQTDVRRIPAGDPWEVALQQSLLRFTGQTHWFISMGVSWVCRSSRPNGHRGL